MCDQRTMQRWQCKGYERSSLITAGYRRLDLYAGLDVAVMLAPQRMVYALLARLPEVMRLYATTARPSRRPRPSLSSPPSPSPAQTSTSRSPYSSPRWPAFCSSLWAS